MSRIVVVTGTDTGVGKTIATAALAARAIADGQRVLVIKPVQSGVGGPTPEEGDAAVVARLSGAPVLEVVALDDPLAPDTAARRQGVELPAVAEHAARIVQLAREHDLVLVEGAGGLLVRLDGDGGTLLDLARALDDTVGVTVQVVVVVRAGLGTLNHAELTVAALRAAHLEPAGIIIGAWPADPGLAETCNREDLPRGTGVPLVAVLPAGAGTLDGAGFRARVSTWFT